MVMLVGDLFILRYIGEPRHIWVTVKLERSPCVIQGVPSSGYILGHIYTLAEA